ncbi:hypothetical protein [Streptomyces sp. bgisy027]|uniref:hypothetical protein n=1 Tax=Streptomyces sp. bgisy027 TaxID=3413770 RepID=UPI003D73B7FE
MRRAADPHQAYWAIADFTDAAPVEDDVLVRALGRQDWGSVFGDRRNPCPVRPARPVGQLLCPVRAVGHREIEQVRELLAALPRRWLLVFDDATPDGAMPRVAVSRMSHAQAIELRTRRLRLDEKTAAVWRDDLDALSEALEGWPLAIELACGYMRTCQIPVERLEHFRILLLDRALADRRSKPAGYPRTLAATVELSLERLAHNTSADDGELPNQVHEILGLLCNFAAQRIPVHLAMACAFISPDIVPAGKVVRPCPCWSAGRPDR